MLDVSKKELLFEVLEKNPYNQVSKFSSALRSTTNPKLIRYALKKHLMHHQILGDDTNTIHNVLHGARDSAYVHMANEILSDKFGMKAKAPLRNKNPSRWEKKVYANKDRVSDVLNHLYSATQAIHTNLDTKPVETHYRGVYGDQATELRKLKVGDTVSSNPGEFTTTSRDHGLFYAGAGGQKLPNGVLLSFPVQREHLIATSRAYPDRDSAGIDMKGTTHNYIANRDRKIKKINHLPQGHVELELE